MKHTKEQKLLGQLYLIAWNVFAARDFALAGDKQLLKAFIKLGVSKTMLMTADNCKIVDTIMSNFKDKNNE